MSKLSPTRRRTLESKSDVLRIAEETRGAARCGLVWRVRAAEGSSCIVCLLAGAGKIEEVSVRGNEMIR